MLAVVLLALIVPMYSVRNSRVLMFVLVHSLDDSGALWYTGGDDPVSAISLSDVSTTQSSLHTDCLNDLRLPKWWKDVMDGTCTTYPCKDE